MQIAVVGFPYAGKTALFCAITGIPRDHLKPSEETPAAVKVPDPRLDWLERLYQPKRRTEATIEFVDLPGSAEGDVAHAGLTKHLPTLRQSDALILVLRAFESGAVPAHGGRVDAQADLAELRDEMLLADLVICDNRLEKIEKTAQKPTADHDRQKHELAVLQRCKTALESERPLRGVVETDEEQKLMRSFGFLTQKSVLTVINTSEEDAGNPPPFKDEHAFATYALCASLETELMQMEPADRSVFMAEYGVQSLARDRLIRGCFDALGLISFLTVGEDEVRAWPVTAGTPAVDAAGKIHSDLARGFIRAETVAYQDLHAAGSMRDAKAAGKVRQESKAYVVQDGDVLNIKFNV
jgi:hypothetical protein